MKALMAISILFSATAATAAPKFVVQGYLTDAANAPITGDQQIKLEVISGTKVISTGDAAQGVTLSAGRFSITYEPVIADADFWKRSTDARLRVSVGSSTPLDYDFGYAAWAVHAESAGRASALFPTSASDCGDNFVKGFDSSTGQPICAGVTTAAGGDITDVLAGAGLSGNTTTGSATLSVDFAQVQAKLSAGSNISLAGGVVSTTSDITSVTTASTSGLVGGMTSGDVALSLKTCATNQVLKYNGGWDCAADTDTTGLTAITSGAGITVATTGTNTRSVAVNATTCTAGEASTFNGSTFGCVSVTDTTPKQLPIHPFQFHGAGVTSEWNYVRGTNDEAFAPVSLPSGSTITKLTCQIYNSHTTAVGHRIMLKRTQVTANGFGALSEIDAYVGAGGVSIPAGVTGPYSHTISSHVTAADHVYFIHVANTQVYNGASNIPDLQLGGCVVTYY